MTNGGLVRNAEWWHYLIFACLGLLFLIVLAGAIYICRQTRENRLMIQDKIVHREVYPQVSFNPTIAINLLFVAASVLTHARAHNPCARFWQ